MGSPVIIHADAARVWTLTAKYVGGKTLWIDCCVGRGVAQLG
jgi:hypothetical protein